MEKSGKSNKLSKTKKRPFEDPNMQRLRGLLREIRAEAQNLQNSLKDIEKILKLSEAQTPSADFAKVLIENKMIFDYNKNQIINRLNDVREVLNNSPRLYDWCSDEITHIENHWERVTYHWPEPIHSAYEILRRITRVNELLHDIIVSCAKITIWHRVNNHLKSLRIGQPLDFHSKFKDEIDIPEDRLKILQRLQSYPGSVDGIVDSKKGLIFRYAKDPKRRRKSFYLMLLLLVSGGLLALLLAYLGDWLNLSEWPFAPTQFNKLFIGYYFVALGGLTHIVIDILKESRTKKEPSFIALEDIFLWIHVKEVPIIGGILSLWLGWLIFAFLSPTIEWQMAFLVGYSVDSVIDLGLQRFTSSVPASVEALRKELTA